jgi:glycosyltransferase involved in cell wall biosynthesis
MRIAIYNAGIPFHGRSPFEGPLGGSESGIIFMARELAGLGAEVTVYCNCPAPGNYDGVRYRHYHAFYSEFRGLGWDVFIGFRSFEPFLVGRVAPRMVYWTGDAFDQPAIANLGHPELQAAIDVHFCVSEWHRTTFIEAFGLDPDRVMATRNGFAEDLLPPASADGARRWTNGVYSSTPFRGLEHLLGMFPHILQRVPEMTLDVFSGMQVYGWGKGEDRERFGRIYALADQPGVTLHGSVGQPTLLRSLANSGLLLYPNSFDETSCIAAIEAQASGAVVVTSDKAGLRETVDTETGVRIPGNPASRDYQHRFVEVVTALVADRERHMAMSAGARERARRLYSWRRIASEWLDHFGRMPARDVVPRWSGPLARLEKAHEYLAKGNRSASLKILRGLAGQPFFPGEVAKLESSLMGINELAALATTAPFEPTASAAPRVSTN